MGELAGIVRDAFALLIDPSAELVSVAFLTFKVTLVALLLATVAGLPAGAMLVMKRFPTRKIVIELLHIAEEMPPVLIGLFIYVLFMNDGPLGFVSLLQTPSSLVLAEFLIAFPLVAEKTRSAMARVDPSVHVGARALGATAWQTRAVVVNEARYGILIAVVEAFRRLMSEVGALLVVGGNIAGATRVITTAIALETGAGSITLVVALGILLLVISVIASLMLSLIRKRSRNET